MRHIFIINPVAGRKNITERVRKEIEGVCARRGLNPLIFISEYNGYERFISEKMCSLFTDEDIRFYCVGGSGTLVQTLSGMDDAPNRQIACYPSGLSNDLLKCYEGGTRGFGNIEALLDGRKDNLDYIKVMGHCKALNFLCIGLRNSMFELDTLSGLASKSSSRLGYGLAIGYDMLRVNSEEYEISIDGKDYSGTYPMILCLNGRCVGGSIVPLKEARPDDGIMNILLFKENPHTNQGAAFLKFYFGNEEGAENLYTQVKGRRLIITRKDHKRMILNCDGDDFTPTDTTLDIRLIPSGVSFIVPQHSTLLKDK